MKCQNCHKTATSIRTAIHGVSLVTTCEHCSVTVQPHQLAAKNRREQQKKDFRKDLVQPIEKRAYSQAYPAQARELYGDKEFRKLS